MSRLRRDNTWYAGNDALNTVTDQKSVVVKHEYKAVEPSTGVYNSQSREYVSSGTPDGGDREVVTTADGLGCVGTVVTKATAGGTQTSKLSNSYKFSGKLWKQVQQLGVGSGDTRTVEYSFDTTCGRTSSIGRHWRTLLAVLESGDVAIGQPPVCQAPARQLCSRCISEAF